MWQRFTEHARRVVFYAQEEAGKLGENHVSTEHILLAILRDPEFGAARVLTAMGIDLNTARSEVEKHLTFGKGPARARYAAYSEIQARDRPRLQRSERMHSNQICTEHLLLGLIHEGEGTAGQTLKSMGASLDKAREVVIAMQSGHLTVSSTGETELRPLSIGSAAAGRLRGTDLIEIAHLDKGEILSIFNMTTKLKKELTPHQQRNILVGKTLGMIFEKPSLRTRVSFETGIFQLGGHGIYLAPADISLGKRESIADVAETLGRMVDLIMARVFAHSTVTELADCASVPVINGLSDLEHPCQALADIYTVLEHKGKLEGLKLAFIGDGNNVAHSLMLLGAKVGMNVTIGCPEGYDPNAECNEGVSCIREGDRRADRGRARCGPSRYTTRMWSTPTSGQAWVRRAKPRSARRSFPASR